jgi:glucokinase
MTAGPGVVVTDVGGTTLRIGRFAADGAVHDVRRIPVDGLDRHPHAPAEALQERVLDQLAASLADYLRSPAGLGAGAVGLAFAGPVAGDGSVTAAPTIWGPGGRPLPVGRILERRLGLPVLIVNDITAAAWRYAATETVPFCVITVSSGIGNKVFRDGEVLLDAAGHGGELGHWRVDPAPDAPRCDCGGRGHLGAIASGRGMLAAARRAAAADPAGFAGSVLAEPAGGVPEAISNAALVAAIRAGDGFAGTVLRRGLRVLAVAVTCLFSAIGVRRYIIIGGFALAVGDRFARGLTAELVELGCFGLRPDEIAGMVRMGAGDDDHSLIGVGRLLSRRLVGSVEGGPAMCAP